MFRPHDFGDLAEHDGSAHIHERIRDTSHDGVGRKAGRVIRTAALHRQDERTGLAPDAFAAAEIGSKLARDLDASRGCPHGAALSLNRDDLRRLSRLPRRVGEILRDDLLAAERHHNHRTDVRMPGIRGERLVSDGQVWPQLTAARKVGQCGADRRDRRCDPLGDDGRTNDGGHDEHLIADAKLAAWSRVALEGLRQRAFSAARSPRPRSLTTLCVCTCVPLAMSHEA